MLIIELTGDGKPPHPAQLLHSHWIFTTNDQNVPVITPAYSVTKVIKRALSDPTFMHLIVPAQHHYIA